MIASEIELKYINSQLPVAASTSTAIITGLTDIVQGDGDSQRDGDRCKLVGTLELRGAVYADVNPGDVTQTRAFVRLIIFQWHPTSQSGGATEPGSADILLTGPTGGVDVWSLYVHDQRQNYSILYDEVFEPVGIAVGAAGLGVHPGIQKYFHRKVPLGKRIRHQMQFQAASATNATNHLYMLSLSNLAADAQNPNLVWNIKVFFRDG